jgi:hypothetical protein
MSDSKAIEIPGELEPEGRFYNPKHRGWKSDHVLVGPRGIRKGVSAVPRGSEGRQVHGGPMVPGPWAYTYGLATCICANPENGTYGEMKRLRAENKVHAVDDGTRLSIDGVTYEVVMDRGEWINLKPLDGPYAAA